MNMNPNEWNKTDVISWAQGVAKLTQSTVDTLIENEIDGATLITLTQSDLKDELGIKSLAARRFFWDAVERVKHQHCIGDFRIAMSMHETEIANMSSPDAHHVDPTVLDTLKDDAARQRQILEDHFLAFRLQGGLTIGQQLYEDSEYAREQQEEDELKYVISEYDHQYALSLSQNRTTTSASSNGFKTLFASCLDVCVKNKIDVAQALSSGQVSIIRPTPSINFRHDGHDEFVPGVDEQKEEPDEASRFIKKCDTCFDENVFGFVLACDHFICRVCLRRLLLTALGDSSLLPLECCEIPIDMNVVDTLLQAQDAATLKMRIVELTAERKMYCSLCHIFINLDFVDRSDSSEMPCPGCRAVICVECATMSHPGSSCKFNQASELQENEALLVLAKEEGWKQCPNCKLMIELRSGCNHITCTCKHEFCFQCLQSWDKVTRICRSGMCENWNEENLIEREETRVVNEERARGVVYLPQQRLRRIQHHRRALISNETCHHDWERREGYFGECERCGYGLWIYAMVCTSDCNSIVCHTCANYRLPNYGWR